MISKLLPQKLLTTNFGAIALLQRCCQSTKSQISVQLAHPHRLHVLKNGPATSNILLTRDEALEYYRKMMTVRRLEQQAGVLYTEKQVRGFCHESVGQEAVPVGMACSLEKGDAVINGYRLHGWAWLMGVTAEEILCELTARINGNVHGKGGSMHMYTKDFYGGHGIVGAQIALGAGLAFAKKYKKQPHISIALYGDGASNQGQFFEAANMCALWKLPCIFVCENNGFGMGTPVPRASADVHMYNRMNYLPGILVDGMDVIAVREAGRWAREFCVQNNGPIVLELDTYRFVGHSVSDPGTAYRTHDEVMAQRKTRDPITHFRDKIVAEGLVTDEEIKEIDKSIKEEIAAASESAHVSGELPPDGLYTDIYSNNPPISIRGVTPQSSVVQKYTTTDQLLKDMAHK